MAEGWGAEGADTALDALGAAYTWIQLHTAAPGAAGTTAIATETTRKQATWGASVNGAMANTNAITWTNIAGSQDATHFTAWTASTAGVFGFSGTINAAAYTAGDTYNIASGDLDVTVTLAS